MANLKALQGETVGKVFPIDGARVTIGRHPQCEVVLEHATVSRSHAQILVAGDEYFVQDLNSRNGTYVNGSKIDGRLPLCNGDEIQLSDVLLLFQQQSEVLSETDHSCEIPILETVDPSPEVDESRMYLPQFPLGNLSSDSVSEAGEIRSKLDARTGSSSDNLKKAGVVPASQKLAAVIEITRSLSRVLELDRVLPRILQTLFKTFPQAEQGFILLLDPKSQRLKVKASRTRNDRQADAVAVSMTVVREAMNSCEAILSQCVADDSRFSGATSLTQLQITSVMCVPLVMQDGRSIGVIQIDSRDHEREFGEGDLELLVSVAMQAAMVVENAQLHEERLAQRDMDRDLEFARQVQRGFLPNERPQLEGYSFSDYYEAAKSVGGDYYDYIPLPNGKVAITLGDVAGKGVSAALLMARLYSSARYLFLTHDSPDDAVTALNEDIASSGMGQRFITFVAMVLDPERAELTLLNAGHMPPLLRLADGETRTISQSVSSLPLGILPTTVYESETIDLPPGASVLAFTDGVTEAMSPERELYGRDRLLTRFGETSGDVQTTMKSLISDVRSFSSHSAERDDTCLVLFRRRF